jgi:hypothetical protein
MNLIADMTNIGREAFERDVFNSLQQCVARHRLAQPVVFAFLMDTEPATASESRKAVFLTNLRHADVIAALMETLTDVANFDKVLITQISDQP